MSASKKGLHIVQRPDCFWQIVDGTHVVATYNSKGAARAGLATERRRKDAVSAAMDAGKAQVAQSRTITETLHHVRDVQTAQHHQNGPHCYRCKTLGEFGVFDLCPLCRVAVADEREAQAARLTGGRNVLQSVPTRDASRPSEDQSTSPDGDSLKASARVLNVSKAHLTDAPTIPHYTVHLRHPVYGWQVVDKADTAVGAGVLFDYWVAVSQRKCCVSLRKIDPVVPQCWVCLRDFDPIQNAFKLQDGKS